MKYFVLVSDSFLRQSLTCLLDAENYKDMIKKVKKRFGNKPDIKVTHWMPRTEGNGLDGWEFKESLGMFKDGYELWVKYCYNEMIGLWVRRCFHDKKIYEWNIAGNYTGASGKATTLKKAQKQAEEEFKRLMDIELERIGIYGVINQR